LAIKQNIRSNYFALALARKLHPEIRKTITNWRNFYIFDFELSVSDMKQIVGINRNERGGSEPGEY